MDSEVYDVISGNVVKRLESLKYEVDNEKDEFLINYITKMVEQDIKNKINKDEVPEGLHYVWVERVCGEFLKGMRGSNMLTDEQIEATVTSIKEGDTQVSFDKDSSPQAIFNVLVSRLINYGNDDFAKYRRFVW
ncbi:MAG: hypothetical protein HFF36_02900 [Coprobacillus sp.]|nr:hypothetical protein [Coprobacillus sp.]